MRRRLFWAMVAVAVVTIVVGGITATILVGRSVADERRSEFYRQAEATARLIEDPLERLGGGQGPQSGRRALRDLGELRALLEVSRTVGGHDYLEATLNTPAGSLPLADDDALLKALPDKAFQPGGGGAYSVEVDGSETLALVRQVDLRGDQTAVVAIGSSEDLVPWRDVAVRLLIGLGIGVVLAAILARLLASSTGRRVDGLADTAHALASGDLGARAPVTGDDEIAELGEVFNDMASRLEESRDRERRFLMSVGHDLRTPLTTIKGYAEALAAGDLDEDQLPAVAATLEMQSDRLARLVEDVMALSRLEASEFTLRPEPVDLAAHFDEVVGAFDRPAGEAQITLQRQLGAVGTVDVDADRIAQVLNNLIENALRYTPVGGTITVDLRREGENVAFSVADTGPGIATEDLPNVFDRLYVAERYRAVRPEGSGLGLNLVKVLVEAMGGTVSAASGEGQGTVVTVSVTSHPATDGNPSPEPAPDVPM